MLAAGETDVFDHVESSGSAFPAGQAVVQQTKFDIVDHAAVADEMEGLEDKSDATGAYPGSLFVAELSDVDAVEFIYAFGRRVEQAE